MGCWSAFVYWAPVSALHLQSDVRDIWIHFLYHSLNRISEIDSVTFLANLILKYQFKVTPITGTETLTETKERVLRWRHGIITIAPEKVPLTFTLRNK